MSRIGCRHYMLTCMQAGHGGARGVFICCSLHISSPARARGRAQAPRAGEQLLRSLHMGRMHMSALLVCGSHVMDWDVKPAPQALQHLELTLLIHCASPSLLSHQPPHNAPVFVQNPVHFELCSWSYGLHALTLTQTLCKTTPAPRTGIRVQRHVAGRAARVARAGHPGAVLRFRSHPAA